MSVVDQAVAGAAVATVLTSGMTSTVPGAGQTMTISDATGYPATGRFTITVDRQQSNEEKILITSRSGTTLTIAQRGYDGTTGQAHTSGQSTVEHPLAATIITALINHVDGVEVNPHNGILLDAADHDIEVRHQFGGAYGTPVTPTALTPDIAGAAGTGNNPAREDHAHNTPAATAVTSGLANAEGTSGSFARADHTHDQAALSVNTAELVDDSVTSPKIGTAAIDDENYFSSGLSPIIIAASPGPGAVGANRFWFNTTSTKLALLKRNAADSAWEVVQSMVGINYTPTLYDITLGNGRSVARYSRSGNTIIANGMIAFGTTSNLNANSFAVGLPVPAVADVSGDAGQFYFHGAARGFDNNLAYAAVGLVNGGTGGVGDADRIIAFATAGVAGWNNTTPFVWGGAGDGFTWFAEYEPASLEDTNYV